MNNLPYSTFLPKSQKPMKAVLWHLSFKTPAQDMSDGLMSIDLVSDKCQLFVEHLQKKQRQ
jgi:hypothetical protein